MDAFLTIFFFILIIGFLVFIHELGHFLAAKITGVRVNEFAIGFGPVILSQQFGDTNYQIRLLPLGGFVSLAGEQDINVEDGFRSKSLPVKTLILTGGVIMNFLGAFIFIAIFLNTQDHRVSLPNLAEYHFSNTTKQLIYYPIGITNVPENSGYENIEDGDILVSINNQEIESADQFASIVSQFENEKVSVQVLDLDTFDVNDKEVVLGDFDSTYYKILVTEVTNPNSNLEVDDVIVGLNDNNFKSFSDFIALRDEFAGSDVKMTILKDNGEIVEKDVTIDLVDGKGSLGIFLQKESAIDWTPLSSFDNRQIYFLELDNNILAAASFTFDLTRFQFEGIGNLIADAFGSGDFDEASQALGGPVAVGGVVNEVVEFGAYDSLIFITALISLSLAMFNILPIPALDGGQLMIAVIESIRKKQLKDSTIEKINFTGFIFLIALSVLIMAKDIVQLDIISGVGDWIQKVFGK